ncbi:MAG TPA: hypothetical protein EYG97_01680 [Arcobacter sp.]|nr:hypothetical protein [Arcobacter sp.]HIP55714.1 hypothetical protein [Arcobacter sp.]
MSKKKGLSKRTIYTIFLAKFAFSLALIFWTIKMTLSAGVGLDDDNTFMSTYHNVDDNYNKIVTSNNDFNKLYSSNLIVNGQDIGELNYDDIYFSQRVIKKRTYRKNILKLNENNIVLVVRDKKTNEIVKNINATIVFTMPSGHTLDRTIKISKSEELYKVDIKKITFWNIMGSVEIDGHTGHFYIKTNAK